MIASPGAEPKLESYLARVRVALRGLPEREKLSTQEPD